MKLSHIFCALFVAAVSSCNMAHQEKTIFTIGSGSKNAMYYPVAVALCDVFNEHNQDKKFVCEARLSKGAEYNLDAVESGEFDMGIAQTNLQYDAYSGSKNFATKPHKNLRTLFNLHDEYLTIITRKDIKIDSFSDLRGKSINIGNPGSGSRVLFSRMVQKMGWSMSDFRKIYEESGSNLNKVLCSPNKADAAVYIVGHPNKSFESILNSCDTKFVNLSQDEVESFLSLAPMQFRKTSIPAKTYPKQLQKINTFASKTVLVASAKLDQKFVQNFVEIISKNKDELVKKQPSLIAVNFLEQSDLELVAPLHDGVRKIKK